MLVPSSGFYVGKGPVKQFVSEQVDEPLAISIYPGADASFLLYEDDGYSFEHRKGKWMGIQMMWNDRRKRLTLQLAAGYRMLPPHTAMIIKLAGNERQIKFEGKQIDVSF